MEGRYPERSNSNATTNIVETARRRVLALFNQHADARLVFHNYQFTTEIADLVEEIARGEEVEEEIVEVAGVAAWFLHTGYLIDYDQPFQASVREADRFLTREKYDPYRKEKVLRCLQSVANQAQLSEPAAQILADAHQLSSYIIDFEERSPLLKLEWELVLDRRLSRIDWAKLQLQHLFQVQLQTHYARSKYEPALAQLIREQKEYIEKTERKLGLSIPGEDTAPRRFFKLEKKTPTRAIQTFFRANYRNHINLSSIADNKANIMISVNSILISVLISILTYRNISENNPMVLLPVVIFLVTGLASLIFAVLSARPKVTQLNHHATSKEDLKKNIVFFGNFVHLDLDDYEEAMDAMFRDNELIYGNMTRDLYYLGKVLDKKYRYLSISYNIFMVGFVATVSTFLFALLT